MIDWNLLLTAGIAAIAPTVFSIAALVQVWKTHNLVNSRMQELLELTRAESAASATLAEKKAEHARQDVRNEKLTD